MKRRLFLTGRARSGKSAMIARALERDARFAGGYVVIFGGFMLPASELAVPEIRRRGRDELNAGIAARYLLECREKPFAVIDELGGPLLADADYYDALIRLLFAGVPIVGVLRDEGAPRAEWDELYTLLSRDPDTLILPSSGTYDTNAAGALRHWTNEYAKP